MSSDSFIDRPTPRAAVVARPIVRGADGFATEQRADERRANRDRGLQLSARSPAGFRAPPPAAPVAVSRRAQPDAARTSGGSRPAHGRDSRATPAARSVRGSRVRTRRGATSLRSTDSEQFERLRRTERRRQAVSSTHRSSSVCSAATADRRTDAASGAIGLQHFRRPLDRFGVLPVHRHRPVDNRRRQLDQRRGVDLQLGIDEAHVRRAVNHRTKRRGHGRCGFRREVLRDVRRKNRARTAGRRRRRWRRR